MHEHHDIRLKRLTFRSWHRGCKETDIILGRFCDTHLATLNGPLLDAFEALLDEDDADIWLWITDKASTPSHYAGLIQMLR